MKLVCVIAAACLAAGCDVPTESAVVGDRVGSVYVVDARTGFCIEFGGWDRGTYRQRVSDDKCARVTK